MLMNVLNMGVQVVYVIINELMRVIRRAKAHFAFVQVVLVRLVHLKEVLSELVQILKQSHLFAQNALVHLDAVLLLQVKHVVVEFDEGQRALRARVVGFFENVHVGVSGSRVEAVVEERVVIAVVVVVVAVEVGLGVVGLERDDYAAGDFRY